MPESSGVYRIIAGRRYEFPDEERARQWDALNQQRMQQYAEREGVASQALTALKSVVPGIVRGTGLAATGIGSLFQAEAPKEFGRGAERLADVISEEYLGVKPYQRLTTGAMLGETLGAMAPAALGTAAAAAAIPETGGLSATLIPAIVGGVIGGAQGAGEVGRDIQEARARGAQISPKQEQKLAAIQGAATAALEGLPLGRLAGEAKALATTGRLAMRKPQEEAVQEVVELLMARAPQLGSRALKSAAIEGGTEATQQLIQNILARGDVSSVTGPGYDPGRELLQGVVESGLVGAGFGGALQGGIDIYNKRQLSKFQSQYRAPEEQSPEIGKILEDAVLSREIAGQRQEQIVAGILSEQRAKALDDALSSAVSTLSDPEKLKQKISSELFGSEYDLLDKRQSKKVDEKLKKELPSPFQRMRAYLEIASQDQFGKLYSELSDAKTDEAERSEREVVNEVARDLFQRRADPNSLAIGIQMREREAPGAVEAKPRPPIETGEVFTGEPLERKQARIQAYKRNKLRAQVEPILNRPIKAPTSRAYIDAEGRVVEPGPVLYQKIQRQKYVPEPVIEGSLEAEKAKGLPGGQLSEEGVFVPDSSLEYEAEAQQRIDDRLQPESLLGKVVQATDQQIGQRQESLKQAYEPAPPPSMEQIVEATAEMPRQIEIEEAQAAEDRQFSRYKKFDRDEYRSVLEGLKSTPDAAISSSYLAKNFGLTPPAANSMMSLMRSRGDIKESDGKLFVNPEAEGPMYKLPKGRKKPVATQVAAPVEPERGTPITRAPKMRLDVETGRKVSGQAYEQLKRLGVSDLYSLVVVDNFLDPEGNINPEGARFLNNVIGLASKVNDIAESEENLINTVNHEVVHGMRKSGFFSDAQWNLLTAKFTPQGELDEDTIAAYQSRFKNVTPERLNEILQEEAVAHAIERLGSEPARPLNLPEKTLMQKVKDLARIGTSANNLGYTAEDLISAVRSGDVGRRAIQGKPNALDVARSAKQRPSVAPIAETEGTQVPEDLTEQERKAAEGESPSELQGSISDENAMFSFVGSKAYSKDPIESARISSFKEAALQMEAIGDNPEDIRLATGWFRNPYDNMWRYEVADENARMTQKFKDLPEGKSIPLSEALDHPELFTAYPDLNGIKVSKERDRWDFWRSTQGWFNPKTNTLNITPYSKDPESTLLHEVQHWIQEHEGFATGGNLEVAKEKATPGQIQAIVRAEVEEKNKELEKTAKRIEELRKSRDFLSAHSSEMAPLIDVERQVDAAWNKFYEHASKSGESVSDPKTEEGKRLKERWEELYRIKNNMFNSVASSIASKSGAKNYNLIRPIIDAMSFKAQELADRESDFVKTQKEIAELSSGDQEAVGKLVEEKKFKLYQGIAGEIESRDVQARKEYTPEKRRETKPLTSENIPPSEALVIKGAPSSEISKETSEPPEEQAMFKLPKQNKPKLFRVNEEKSLLDIFKTNPINQIPAAIRDAVIDKPSVRKVIGPGSSLGKVLSLRQDWLQADAPSAKLQEKLYWEKGDEKYTNTASSAISAIRQSQKFNELLSSALNDGYIYFDKAVGFFRVKKDDRYAIMPQFKKLAAKGKLYQAWDAAIAQRFVDVENSGRDAKSLLGGTFTLKQAQDTVDQYKNDADIQEFLKVYRNFNNALIDLNLYVGNYDAATAAKLKAWFYSPYYRVPVDENGYLEAPSASVSRITNLQSAKAISGRELDINDAIENFITNAQYMVGYAMKNQAARRSTRDAVDGKLATRLEGKDDKGNLISSPRFATDKSKVVRVNEGGKRVYYEIHDPLLYKSLNNTQVRLASLAVLGRGFSNWLRTGVTSAPTFMLNNMFLDAFRLWGLGIYQDNFFKSIAGNIASGIQSVRKEDDVYQTLVRAGLIGNMKLSRDSVQAAMDIRRQLAIEQGNSFVNLLRQIKNYTLGTAEALSAKSEAVNRVQVYKNVKKDMAKQGLSPEAAESAALFAAMEYPVNFDVRGNGEIAQYAAALFPFVNASAQGTDVFYRNIRAMAQTRGVMLGGKKQRAPVNQLQAAALDASKRVLVSSLIYGTLYTFFLAASDNEEWKKATPDERNRTLFLPVGFSTIKIPVPPEMGMIALALPNAFAEAIYGQDNGKQILKHLASYFANLFTFSPVPQIVRPAAEVALNKNFFTWRPIENMAQQKLSPEYRYDETTTGVGRGLGVAAEKLSMPISPIQFDHLIRGYLGTSGIFVSDLIGQLFGVTLNKNEPERFRPLTDPYLLPGIGKKFAAPTDRKAIDDYYQIRNMATQAANNLKAIDAARVYETDPQKLRSMAYWAQINKALEAGPEKRMEELRKLKSQVQAAPAGTLTPAQKTDMLKQINLKMNEVARGVQHLKRHVPFTWF